MFSSVHSIPSQNPKLASPGKEFGLHHRFTAYDCEHPTTVQALKLPAHCLTRKTDSDNTNQTITPLTLDKDPYKLLQKATYYEFDAHQCIQTRSRFFFSCVWASHSVINAVPQTRRYVATTIDFCTQAVKTKTYVTAAGNSVALRTDGHPTYIPETLAGEIMISSGTAACQGEDIKHNGKTLKQTMVLQETHFVIRKVKIRKNFDSGDLMIVETSTTIPANLIKPGGFSIDSGTYIIPRTKTPCAYQIIKTFIGTAEPTNRQDDLIITSQKGQVHIHTHGMLNPPTKCPIQGTYRKTGHSNIIVFQPVQGPTSTEDVGFNPIDARQVSIPNMITLKVEWALYKTSKKFGLVHDISQQSECAALKRLTSGEQTQPELQGSSESLLYAKGEMLYDVKCPRIEASLDLTLNDHRCYKYLPVVTGNPPVRSFLIPGSRLLSNVSETEPCQAAQKVPRGYLSTGGYWVAACPREKILSPPTELQLEVLTTPDTYEEEAKGGAYMDRDLAEWARVFTWDTRRTITQTYEERISQSMGFADQFRQGFTREQFANYLNTIEAQATFMSFLDPIAAYLTPKLIFFGSVCSVTICCCTGVMSLHGAYRYIEQSRLAKVTVSIVTVLKLLCCAPATILSDDMFQLTQHAIAANYTGDYGNIADKRRLKKQRKKKPTSEPSKNTKVQQDEVIYEEFNPYVRREQLEQQDPSAPGPRPRTNLDNPLTKEIPFVYPAVLQTARLYEDNHPMATDNPPAYL